MAEPSMARNARPSSTTVRTPEPKARPATTSSRSRKRHDQGESPAANAARSAALSFSIAARTTVAPNRGNATSMASARIALATATQRALRGCISAVQQGLDPRGADEVVQGEAADIVSGPQHLAMAIARFEVRMMIFLVGHEAHGVDEAEGVVKVGETEILDDGLAVGGNLPAGQACQVAVDGGVDRARAPRPCAAGSAGWRAGRGSWCIASILRKREASALAVELSKDGAQLESVLKWC